MRSILGSIKFIGGKVRQALGDFSLQLLLSELIELLEIHSRKSSVELSLPNTPDLFDRVKFRAARGLIEYADALAGDPGAIDGVLVDLSVVHDDDGPARVQWPFMYMF